VLHEVLEELNGSCEDAQQFGTAALCIADDGQFAPQQFASTPSEYVVLAWA